MTYDYDDSYGYYQGTAQPTLEDFIEDLIIEAEDAAILGEIEHDNLIQDWIYYCNQ